MPDDEGIPDFPEADIPDFPEEESPACPIPSQASRFVSSPGSPRPAPPQNSMPGWDMAKTMCQAGGASLDKVISAAEDAMPSGGMPVASERAGGESRRTGLKRKAGEITRSAAEDFALLTTRTSSMRYAADFLSTVGNVSFSDVMPKYIPNHLNTSNYI
jgi:hypothetical protein